MVRFSQLLTISVTNENTWLEVTYSEEEGKAPKRLQFSDM